MQHNEHQAVPLSSLSYYTSSAVHKRHAKDFSHSSYLYLIILIICLLAGLHWFHNINSPWPLDQRSSMCSSQHGDEQYWWTTRIGICGSPERESKESRISLVQFNPDLKKTDLNQGKPPSVGRKQTHSANIVIHGINRLHELPSPPLPFDIQNANRDQYKSNTLKDTIRTLSRASKQQT